MNKKIGLVLLGLATLGLSSCGAHIGPYENADKYIAGNVEYANVEVNKINIDWVSGVITLVEDENATGILVSEDTDLTDPDALVHTYFHDGILDVKYFASDYWCHQVNYKKELTLTYRPGLESLNVDITSGRLAAENIRAKEFDLNLTSGSASIGNIVAENIDVDMTSGECAFSKINSKNFDADLTSGTARVNFDEIEKATFDLTSGDIDMSLPVNGGTVKVSKTSGKVITNRECTISEDTYKFGDGTADIKVSMTSGTLTIG